MRHACFLLLAAVVAACTPATTELRRAAIDPLRIERELAATDPAHQPHESDDGLTLGDRAHVSAEGATIAAGGGHIRIALAAFGRGTALAVAADAEPTTAGPEVRIARAPGVTEWWRSLPSGLEQGVTLDERPAGDEPLILEMSVGEGVVPETVSDDAITLRDAASGASLASYAGLVVIDADGAAVPARMAAAGPRIRIEIDDAGAAYPLVVDPLIVTFEATLPGPIAAMDARGTSAAISGDGRWALVGVTTPRIGGEGEVHTFERIGSTWTARTVVGGPSSPAGGFGASVAVTPDATRAVSFSSRAVTILARTGTAWTIEVTLPGDCTGNDAPQSIDISDDGARVAVTARNCCGGAIPNATCVYMRTGTTWARELQLPSLGATVVAISGAGDRIFAAGSSLQIFQRSGTTWMSESTVPLTSSAFAVDATTSGDRAFVAGVAVSVFARAGTTWSFEANLPTAGPVAVSGDGFRAVVGSPSEAVATYARSGTTWTAGAVVASVVPAGSSFGAAVALTADGTRLVVGAPRDATVAAAGGSAHVFTLAAETGDACGAAADCLSGFCVDGVCCSTACGGGATDDCQACSAAAGGSAANGTCGALTSAVAPTVTCRPVASVCDRAEVCTSASIDCPRNDPAVGGTVCRPALGGCDRDEMCDGTAFTCPPDSFQSVGTPCGGTATSCSSAGMCTGSSPTCAGGTLRAAGAVCLARDGTNPCDVDDVCDGTTDACRPAYAMADVACGPASTDACDAPDHCSGTSADCVAVFLDGVVCRTPAGSCDTAELCLGDSAACPPDLVLATGIVCNPSAEACDPAEVCDGTSAMCPGNVTCPVDGGVATDAGPGIDAGGVDSGATPDAGAAPAAAGGCSCRAGGDTRTAAPLGLFTALAVVVRRRRARAARSTNDRTAR